MQGTFELDYLSAAEAEANEAVIAAAIRAAAGAPDDAEVRLTIEVHLHRRRRLSLEAVNVAYEIIVLEDESSVPRVSTAS